MTNSGHIGIFDSGIGGLSVANLLYKRYPSLSITYLADNAFFPFGDKDEQQIYDRLVKGIELLEQVGCDEIVIACNTASIVLDKYDIPSNVPVTTITNSVLDAIVDKAEMHEFHVLATKYTIKSYFYQQAIKQVHPDAQLYAHALPDWVRYVENELGTGPGPALQLDFNPGPNSVIIVACTHFSFVLEHWLEGLPKDVYPIDSSKVLADNLYNKWSTLGMKRTPSYKLMYTAGVQPHVELTPDIPWVNQALPYGEIV